MADVILIGEDNQNGLGLVRSFGTHGIKAYGIIMGSREPKGFLRYSKYWKNVFFAKDEQEILEILLKQNFSTESVLIPYSDGASQVIDLNLNELSKHYLCPSIRGKQGEIARLMDKMGQTNLAQQIGVQMLPAQIIHIAHPLITLSFPLIVKPVVSVEGQKKDIRVCYTRQEVANAIQEYQNKSYKRALVQTYLAQRTEYVLGGSVLKDKISFTLLSNVRIWPMERGTGSFSKFCLEPGVTRFATTVLQKILDLGYQGPIDIEFFQDANGQFYLNEINWRSGGRNFVSLHNNVHSAYFYYCMRAKEPLPANEPLVNDKEGFSMNEVTDLRHVVFGKLPLKSWINDWKHTHSFALWYGKFRPNGQKS